PEVVKRVSTRVANGESPTPKNEEERKVLNLLKQVNGVAASVPGSSTARVAMGNETSACRRFAPAPTLLFYLTINPADVYNPLVKFLAGEEIDVDSLLPADIPNYWYQSVLVAKNPAVAARFFNLYMKAFISALLGYDPEKKDLEGGILGVVKAHYSCVE
ncbi:hypothetical protein B0H19DRAFT_887420, partial [Mycena capillaripes]